jgi:hypothetical protein
MTMKPIETLRDGTIEVLARKPRTSHPEDNRLETVLCRRTGGQLDAYVVWSRNLDYGPDALDHGHYCRTLVDAARVYDDLGTVKTKLAEMLGKVAT